MLPSSTEVSAPTEGPDGILAGIEPGFALIDLSGTDPDFPRSLQQKLEARKAHFVGATLHASGAPAVTIPKGLASIVAGGAQGSIRDLLWSFKRSCSEGHLRLRAMEGIEDRDHHVFCNQQHHQRRGL